MDEIRELTLDQCEEVAGGVLVAMTDNVVKLSSSTQE